MTVQRTDWAEEFVAGFLGLPLAIDTILLRPQRRDRVGDREVWTFSSRSGAPAWRSP